jgi:large subunit ribosomal protein L21
MFAVIKTGGKQYRVEAGDVIVVEKLPVAENGAVTFDEVLMVGDKVGTPTVAGASVAGELMKQAREKKIIVFKKKRRQNYRRKHGHRQQVSVVRITNIAVA